MWAGSWSKPRMVTLYWWLGTTMNVTVWLRRSTELYKLKYLNDFGERPFEAVRIKNLGGDSTFLPPNCSGTTVFASKYRGCKPNSIHYLTSYPADLSDEQIEVFNVEDGTVESSAMRRRLGLHHACRSNNLV